MSDKKTATAPETTKSTTAQEKPVEAPSFPKVYVEYVHNKSIADIAEDHDMTPQEVLDVIASVESKRSK